MKSHYSNQWWPILQTHICVTQSPWMNFHHIYFWITYTETKKNRHWLHQELSFSTLATTIDENFINITFPCQSMSKQASWCSESSCRQHKTGCGLTHWGRVTHICVSKLTNTGSDNGLSPERHQAIIRPNAGIFLIRPIATNFGEILIEIQTFSSKKIRLKMSSAKCCLFRLGLNVF